MDVRSIVSKKRDGGALAPEESEAFIAGFVAGEIPDYQASALLMAIFLRGMQPDELWHWTRAMLRSGDTLAFPAIGAPKIDKHSTGGVGDKASLPLAPAVAACGVCVPMISGRGLGHTGGTLDKLEAIPGLRTDLAADEFARVLGEVGCAMGGQTRELVPADQKLYALRDVTGLIESVPLIASSILSKKLAEGIDGLVLDVKFGSGAFFPEPERGAELARAMLDLAERAGLRAAALQTAMDRPLGLAVGHALEVAESLECLAGGGPGDLRELVCALGGEMLALAGAEPDAERGAARIARALDDGSARAVFGRMVAAQGGSQAALERGLERARGREVFAAERDGWLAFRDVRAVGLAAGALGGGRRALGDALDLAVGLVATGPAGRRVSRGEPLFEIHHNGRGLAQARAWLARAVAIESAAAPSAPLVRGRLRAEAPAR